MSDEKSVNYEQLREKRVMWPVAELIEWDKNPRSISRKDYESLKKDMTKQFKPLLVMPDTEGKAVVIGGNMRLKAMRDLGWEDAWVSVIEFGIEGDKWVSYVNGDRDKEFKTKEDGMLHYALRDNEEKGYMEELKLQELAYESFLNLEDYKIEPEDSSIPLSDFVDRAAPQEIEEDEAPEVSAEPAISKLGEIYQLGRHRLMCGDSTKIEDVEKLMNGQKADMVFTDPPYGVSYASKNEFLNNQDKGNRIQTDIENDTMNLEDTSDFIYKAFVNIRLMLKDKSCYYITAPQGGDLMMMMMMMMMQKADIPLRHMLIWVKNNHVLGRTDYNYKHEPILYGWVNTHNFYGKGRFQFSTWEIDKPLKNDLHPTMKPIALMVNAMENSTLENDTVLDLFGGSGSTLIACEQLNRTCYMMEIDPKYVDVIRKRYWKLVNGSDEGWEEGTKAEVITEVLDA